MPPRGAVVALLEALRAASAAPGDLAKEVEHLRGALLGPLVVLGCLGVGVADLL